MHSVYKLILIVQIMQRSSSTFCNKNHTLCTVICRSLC